MRNHQIEYTDPNILKPFSSNAPTHSKKQVKQIARSIERFGFNTPVLIDTTGTIIAGHGRLEAAKLLKLETIPTIRLAHLSETERRAYIIADNKLAQSATWNADLLAAEVQYLLDAEFDIELTGFQMAELDVFLEELSERSGNQPEPEDHVPAVDPATPIVSRAGDRWTLGNHVVVCGDARNPATYAALLGDDRVDLVFTDPPYNVPIDGHVCGLGRAQHREFAMASGEMTPAQFEEFLQSMLRRAQEMCRPGAILFVCMDWRHARELLGAARTCRLELKNICVWNRTNGGLPRWA